MTSSQSAKRSSLLLLPPAPSPPSYAALKAAYGSSIFSVLRNLSRASERTSEREVLEIALPCPHLYGQEEKPRSSLYHTTQRLVAGLYKLICVISAKEAIDLEDAEGVDPRIVLVSYPRNGKPVTQSEAGSELDMEGPIVDIRTLACSGRPWRNIYSVESEEGEQVLKNFLAVGDKSADVKKVRGGIVQVSPEHSSEEAAISHNTRRHYSVAVGGTFDHLHIGHKLLLTMTAFVAEGGGKTGETIERSLTVGVTGDELLKNKKYADFLESWDDRQQEVDAFMRSILDFAPAGKSNVAVEKRADPGPNGHAVHIIFPSRLVVKCVEIWDPFGPTITDESITALVVSAETRSGGKAVNDERTGKGWPELEVYEVSVLDAEEESDDGGETQEQVDQLFQSKISSTEIRRLLSEKSRGTSRV